MFRTGCVQHRYGTCSGYRLGTVGTDEYHLMAKDSLNAKQEAFVREYLLDSNGTQAAIRAGYSEHTAESQASRLLRNVKVEEAIAAGRKKLADKVEITKETIAARFDAQYQKADSQDKITEATNANKELAKLLGHYIEKSENTGKLIVEFVTDDE
jgi:phage terminase small subunit